LLHEVPDSLACGSASGRTGGICRALEIQPTGHHIAPVAHREANGAIEAPAAPI